MNLTKYDVARLRRRAQQPTREPGELLAVFVAGRLENPLNGTPWVWQKRTRYARQWKDRVYDAIFEAVPCGVIIPTSASAPKRVAFLASTWNTLDDDGLRAALKPVRDALIECDVISGDAPKDGHEFVYAQRIDRARRGVEIRIRLRGDA